MVKLFSTLVQQVARPDDYDVIQEPPQPQGGNAQEVITMSESTVQLRVNNIGSNMTEIQIGDYSHTGEKFRWNVHILFSYKTPVAGYCPEGFFYTDEYFSKTTSRHINKYFQMNGITKADADQVPQDLIEGLLSRSEVTLEADHKANVPEVK